MASPAARRLGSSRPSSTATSTIAWP